MADNKSESGIGYPPGHTHCNWCGARVAWKDAEFTHDNELLCSDCWQTWLAIIAEAE